MSDLVTMRPRLLAAILILVVLGSLWTRSPVQPLGRYDQPFYLGIAHDLLQEGRFTDGFRFAGDAEERPSGMRFTPLYPGLLAAVALVDPKLRQGMACVVATEGRGADCRQGGRAARGLQFLLLAVTLWILWWSGWRCTGRQRTGWLALGLALLTAPLLLESVNYLMTEITSLFLLIAATALGLRGMLSPLRRCGWTLAAGTMLGLAVLDRPAVAWLGDAVLLAGIGLAATGRHGMAGWRRLGSFGLGLLLPVVPWIVRNALVLERPALTFGYGSHTLVQRLSFDSMSWHEYAMSFVCLLPDGNGIGAALGGRHACDRFSWDQPDSFYMIGIGPMLTQTLQRAGGWSGHMSYLLHTYLLRDPLRQLSWHAMVTLPLALRGMYVDHYWGLLLAPVCAVLTVRALRRRGAGDGRYLLLALPAWFMLLFNAAVAVNQVRYNLLLVLPFSIAGAMVIEGVPKWLRLLRQRAADGPYRIGPEAKGSAPGTRQRLTFKTSCSNNRSLKATR